MPGRRRRIAGLVWAALSAVGAIAGPPTEPIRIGVISGSDPAGERFAAGAAAAAGELSGAAATGNRPVEVVRLPAAAPWRDGAGAMASLIFRERVIALIGADDGTTAHVAAQVATRARIPILTTSAEDGLTQIQDPWILRIVPSDGDQARAVLRWQFPQPAGRRVRLVVPDGREGRERRLALERACAALGVGVAGVEMWPASAGPADAAPAAASASALLLWLDPGPALSYLAARASTVRAVPLLGSLRLDDPAVRSGLTTLDLRIALPRLWPARDDDAHGVADSLGRDAVALVVAAVGRVKPDGGLTALREALRTAPPLTGRSGRFAFDGAGNRRGDLAVGLWPPPDRGSP